MRHPHCSLKWKAIGMILTREKMKKNEFPLVLKRGEAKERSDLPGPILRSGTNLVQSYSLLGGFFLG